MDGWIASLVFYIIVMRVIRFLWRMLFKLLSHEGAYHGNQNYLWRDH